ncbi:MAG: hypothetical protein KJ989_15265 [Gammaproteobacteria bacterium]|uniref:Uncharacterized protein n=1 Tax=viral metagenome TaxID=1070528 RepID=A0A6M3J6G9_9ZZZZ|nr:hypothetical protein [Gammaproteobacteria bacterium]MBU2067477.1 hypothetical protein [Gammaproteobacteria bacterium]MBU2139487.1 hypothetical protein [Gammaproteobacteria bacterium]MBU2255914.1 hypothetical protein [Gammaproteobacteria bacterium]MBU2295559.1 hypothetical protein [Gammaproteobacteria bacterium]
MTRGTDLTADIKANLELINPAAGYYTDLKGVFELRAAKDNQPMPFALLAWQDDATEKRGLRDAQRLRSYAVQGVFPSEAALADLEKFHFDVLRALGYGARVFGRPINAVIVGDSAEIEPAIDGSTKTTITITLEARYTEAYA